MRLRPVGAIIITMALRTYEERRLVRLRRIGRLWRRLGVRIVVSVFVCWHIFALAIYNLPNANPLIQSVLQFGTTSNPVMLYIVGIQFLQGWNMFAPNPYGSSGYIAGAEADIQYANGEHRIWRFPQPSNMPHDKFGEPIYKDGKLVHDYWLGYNTERWRKYLEVIDNSSNDYLWPGMAKYAARMNNDEPNNLPTSVQLFKYSGTVVGPGQDQPPPQRVLFDTVVIEPEDLK
jgi:hypothetical protein